MVPCTIFSDFRHVPIVEIRISDRGVLENFSRLKGEDLGMCFSTVGSPGALFRFLSTRFQVVDFWSNFGVFQSVVFRAYLSK